MVMGTWMSRFAVQAMDPAGIVLHDLVHDSLGGERRDRDVVQLAACDSGVGELVGVEVGF